jgi:hypothetical protein
MSLIHGGDHLIYSNKIELVFSAKSTRSMFKIYDGIGKPILAPKRKETIFLWECKG